MSTFILYIGRTLLGAFFLYGGFGHFKNLEMMSGYAQAKGAPFSRFAVAFTGVLLVVGGLSVLFNVFPVIGFLALILFLVPVTFIMHAPWKVLDSHAKMGEMVNFTKNLALLGSVLILLAYALA